MSVTFEGVEHQPWKDGKFRCPWKCGDPDYPQPKWSTEKGFTKHLENCRAKPDADLAWTPGKKEEPVKIAECEDCGQPIMKMNAIWQMVERFVCLDCCKVYQEAGLGYMDCAGLQLPKFLLEG